MHAVGLVLLASEILASLGAVAWLYRVGRYPYSWNRKLVVPKLSDTVLELSDDVVGLV